MPNEPFSFVLEFAAASPEDARRHFLSKLAVETDVSDVATDLERKRGGFVVVDVRNRPTPSDTCLERSTCPGAPSTSASRPS
jgi:hypothetical protein